MNANARKGRGTVVIFGVACAVAAALPCVAADAGATAPITSVTVQAPDKVTKKKSAPAEENVGFFSGLAIGAVAGGPIGAVAGGITGALLGEHFHKQKVANQELASNLSRSTADTAKLSQTVTDLGGSLNRARQLTFNISFRTGDANLTTEDIDELTTLGQLAGGMSGVRILVSGYADPRGPKDYNTQLSKDRAESVAAVLTNSGLDQDRVVIEALGANGVDETHNLDDYAFQRRVSVKLIGATEVAATPPSAAVKVASAE